MTLREAVSQRIKFSSQQVIKNLQILRVSFKTTMFVLVSASSIGFSFLTFSSSQHVRTLIEAQNERLSKLEFIQSRVQSNLEKQTEQAIVLPEPTPALVQILGESTTVSTGTPHETPDSTVVPLGMVQVINSGQGNQATIYDDPIKKNIIATINAGTILFYSKKSDGWYFVEVSTDTSKMGWIRALVVSEISQ